MTLLKGFFFLLLGITLGTSPLALASKCVSSEPIKRRVVVAWIGIADNPVFDNELEASLELLKTQSDLVIGAFGANSRLKSHAGWVAAIPSSDGLIGSGGILDLVNRDFSKYQTAGGKASDYEITMVVSNHGSRVYVGSTPLYGIFGDDGENLGPSVLRRFAGGLPKGIRFKGIFSECFSSDAMMILLQALPPESCGCGAAASPPDHTSLFWNSKDHFDSAVLQDALTPGGTLTSGTLKAFNSDLPITTLHEIIGEDDPVAGENAALTSSEVWAATHLMSQFGITDWNDLETQVQNLLLQKVAQAPELSETDQALMHATTLARGTTLADLMGLSATQGGFEALITSPAQNYSPSWTAEDSDNFRNRRLTFKNRMDDYQTKNARLAVLLDKYHNHLSTDAEMTELQALAITIQQMKPGYYSEQQELLWIPGKAFRNTPASVLAGKLLARHRIDELFLKTATPSDRESFFQLRACEQQSMVHEKMNVR